MIHGLILYTDYAEEGTYGRVNAGFRIAGASIIAIHADIILERNLYVKNT